MRIEVKNLSLFSKDASIFENFNHNFEKGITEIIGKNGSGKTALLRMVAGLDNEFEGRIENNNEIMFIPAKAAIGGNHLISQQLNFFKTLHGKQNQDIPFNLEKFKNKKNSALSSGQKQMVNLSRLSFGDVKIWLLDEPFNHLDEINKKILQNFIEKNAENKIILIAHHKRIFNGMFLDLSR